MRDHRRQTVGWLLTVLLLGIVTIVVLRAGESSPPAMLTTATATAAPQPAAAPEMLPADVAAAPDGPANGGVAAGADRDRMPGGDAPSTGTVRVRVVHADAAPAAQMVVGLRRRENDSLLTREALTDADGSVLFAAVLPGAVRAYVPHDRTVRAVPGEVGADAVTELTIVLQAGLSVTGRVVDGDGANVAGAEVVVGMPTVPCATVVGHSGDDGTFRLRAMPTDCLVGARKPGYRPSPMRFFMTRQATEVSLTIRLERGGGRLAGVVLGPGDRPIAGALVQVGFNDFAMQRLADGTEGSAPSPQQARTDAEGRFTFATLSPGTHPASARALDLAPWAGNVTVEPDGTTTTTVRLSAGVTLVGTVRDRDGKPVAEAAVRTSRRRDPDPRLSLSAADGTFRMSGLDTGVIPIRAEHASAGKAETSVQGQPGEVVRWDVVLDAGVQQAGRVLGPEDVPQHPAYLTAEDAAGNHLCSTETDAGGRFVVTNCPAGQPIHLSTKRTGMFTEQKLTFVASSEELVIRLPTPEWAYVEGTVLDPDGEPRVNVRARLLVPGEPSPILRPDPATGRFRFGPLPPGSCGMRFSCDDLPDLSVSPRILARNEIWDVGTLRFERGGTAVVQLITDTSEPLPEHRVSVLTPAGEWRDSFLVREGTGRTPPLASGTWLLQVALDGFAARQQAFDIRAGVEARLDVPLQRGVPCEVTFEAPADLDQSIDVVVRDATGSIVLRRGAWRRDGRITLQTTLAPGPHTITASCLELRGTGTLTVAAPGPIQTHVPMSKP